MTEYVEPVTRQEKLDAFKRHMNQIDSQPLMTSILALPQAVIDAINEGDKECQPLIPA